MQLHASDPDNDLLSYSLLSDGPIPTGHLGGDGLLSFAPAPGEVGTYHLTAVASDGKLQALQPFVLTVAPTR